MNGAACRFLAASGGQVDLREVSQGLRREDGGRCTRRVRGVGSVTEDSSAAEGLDGHLPSPAGLLEVDPGKLREAGLSWRKVSTLRDLAERFSDSRLNPDVLSALPDEELMAELTTVPGIGPWTVQGALLIALQREDIVLPGDLALRKAVQAAYRLGHLPSQQEVLSIAEKWRPHRSLATSYLFSAAFEPAGTPPVAPSET
jgi:DNA-3-methyladenine glycosylase II